MSFVRPLVATAFVVSLGMSFVPSDAGAQRKISDVEWRDWQKEDLYLGRFGKTYSIGVASLPHSGPAYFLVYQVKNTSPNVIDASCEVKETSKGLVAYTLEQRLNPGQMSDLNGAGDMRLNHEGERFTASCRISIAHSQPKPPYVAGELQSLYEAKRQYEQAQKGTSTRKAFAALAREKCYAVAEPDRLPDDLQMFCLEVKLGGPE
jgi:hypothetical protein